MRHRAPRVAAVAVLALLAAGCGGDDEPAAEAGTPSPSASATTSAARVEQPDTLGVDVRVTNLDAHAGDPAVARWRLLNAAIVRTTNDRTVAPALRQVANDAVVRDFAQRLAPGWKDGWTVPNSVVLRIEDSQPGRVIGCLWSPSQAYRGKDGKSVGTADQSWLRIVSTYSGTGDALRFGSFEVDGTCAGEAP
ncbi:hypothetical protein [Aeromicrobium massiliense]|uniref:hypothetical protein n=1 Tax=Aeromicrobium massiliense TaxID=1464554 RepID=UPI000AC39C2A|nr:hypothetical protein [Aeromicrobium massiliense]